jgi:hypothetical protein
MKHRWTIREVLAAIFVWLIGPMTLRVTRGT